LPVASRLQEGNARESQRRTREVYTWPRVAEDVFGVYGNATSAA